MGVSLFSPAKLNLYLAVTGRRVDGFHDLVSVAAPLTFGDELRAEETGRSLADGQFTLVCDDPAVPVDGSNLVLKAAAAFAAATGWTGRVDFQLAKRIPMGAGLGGGSSNAVAALRALQELAGQPLSETELAELAATLGSDCVLFLQEAPVIMRGRGERVERLPESAAQRLRGQRVLVFKPSFGVSTPWAYQRMVARGTDYRTAAVAEKHLADWVAGDGAVADLCFNNMEPAVFEKYLGLPVLLEGLAKDFGVVARMSGSGSACFAWLEEGRAVEPLRRRIQADWGSAIFMEVMSLA